MTRIQMFVTNGVTHDARVLREAEALAEAGKPVEIVGTRDPGTLAGERRGEVAIVRLDRDPLPARLVRRAIAARTNPRSSPAAPHDLSDAAQGSVVTPAMLSAGWRPKRQAVRLALSIHLTLAWLSYARAALRVARRAAADVLVAHDLDTLPVAALAARRSGARLVYDSHELFLEHETEPPRSKLTRAVQRAVERRLVRRADRVITVNGSIAEELARRYGIPRPRVVRNVPAWTTDGEDPVDLHERLGLPPGMRIAIYLGGLAAGRGLEQLASSAAELPGVAIVFLGPAPPQFWETLHRIAAASGAGDRVKLLPPVPAADVTRWAAGADVGVVPYRNTCMNNYLSLPNKLFEYLAAGLPVVTSGFPELRRVVTEHGIGTTFDPEDPIDIARAVRDVVSDRRRLDELRAAAARAAAELSWEREKGVFLEVFEELAREPA